MVPVVTTTATTYTLADVARITGARPLSGDPAPDIPIAGISIDSRALRPGELFAAIKGERHDAHHFVGPDEMGNWTLLED
jgi:UDP-N-acetylmuramoyl-tripeptide--D-alanyl-D-alanine ligase